MTFTEADIHRSKEFDQESQARIAYAASLTPGAHIHISGVCGTGTGSVLRLLKDLGFRVSGSDKAFYPPMGAVVQELADVVYEGYRAENLNERPDLVVIGNSLPLENPEVQYVLAEKLPYASMPEVLAALLIGDRSHCKTSVVITGTHGKTTTTALCAWMLEYAKRKPGFFVGGMAANLKRSIRAVATDIPLDRRVVVLEGDEYDSAFFAKFSKFHCYRPDIAVITSLEFDHADIYESLEDIEREFLKFAARLPEDGFLLVADNSEQLDSLVKRLEPSCKATVFRYGEQPHSTFRLLSRSPWMYRELPSERVGQELQMSLQGKELVVRTRMSGEHNAMNALACAAVCRLLGVGEKQLAEAVQQFEGVQRRQQVLVEVAGITVIEDFAHHPTAVQKTIAGIRESYQPKRLVAVFDPRSNTSRRSYFQQAYAASFEQADLAVLREVVDPGSYSGTDEIVPLDIERLIKDIAAGNTPARAFRDIADLQDFLLQELQSGDLALLMSNGSFEGLPQTLPEALRRKHGGQK